MTIWNFGSINIDYVYRLPHLPAAGETLAAASLTVGLGGKGANQSVAAARAGSRVHHIGAVGAEGAWARDRLAGYGVDVTSVRTDDGPSGHAIINVDAAGENSIVIFPGANVTHSLAALAAALAGARPGDLLLLQNETNYQPEAAALARKAGLRTIYSAAPFQAQAVMAVLDHVDILAMNQVEAEQLTAAIGRPAQELPVSGLLITRGARGASYFDTAAGTRHDVAAFAVPVVDTTGAGDTFAGYFAAGLDQGLPPDQAMRLAAGASSLKVTRAGAADAIPTRAEVQDFLDRQP